MTTTSVPATARPTVDRFRPEFEHYERTKDFVDEFIDIMLNHRQSGHPGGSRSKVHALTFTMLSGAMRHDLRHPEKSLGDRFVLVAGHCTPLVYAMLAVLNEAMRLRHQWTGDARFLVPGGPRRVLLPSDLLMLRRNKGLAGHAEMEGKTLFFKFNTGPSGHGAPAAAGQALALKMAGAEEVKVFAFEGEGGHTAGAHHETKNSAYGLGLSNLVYCLDWNDNGIDDAPISAVVHGTPRDWFESYGFKLGGTEHGSTWEGIATAFCEVLWTDNPDKRPRCVWFKTIKGRGYGVEGYKSHGTPHKRNHELFWANRKKFQDQYGCQYPEFGSPDPSDSKQAWQQAEGQLRIVCEAMAKQRAWVEWVTDRLVQLGDSVPELLPGLRVSRTDNPLKDPKIIDPAQLPAELFVKAGTKAPNRQGLGTYGAYVNSYCMQRYGRPLVVAMAADLAESTNIAGFAKDFGALKNAGKYQRDKNPGGALLDQEITEFTNSGISVGMATVNFHQDPEREWAGYVGACSTYGSFSYLKYGPMRLFSQLAQDCELRTGKVIWVAGHSGPETAEDSRTHFGIFAPGVTQLFPDGWTINLHPWEHNEVAPALAMALGTECPIVALHLTRPAVDVPDREALGIPSYMMSARGAYVMKPFDPGRRKEGTVIVLGTSSTASVVKILPELKQRGPNVKIVCAVSPELFRRQPKEYRDQVLPGPEWMDSMVIANQARRLMHDWIPHKLAERYCLTPDHDNRWRTGGSVEEIVKESGLDPESVWTGIERFARERETRRAELRALLQD
jgi:transketolase